MDQLKEKAVFVGIIKEGESDSKVEEYLDELQFLAETAGVEGDKKFVQRLERPDNATYIRSGKLQEIADYCEANEIKYVIFDDELSGTQQRNIEKVVKCSIVIDRTSLILEIFAQRAKTAYAKMQVELARYNYMLPRLAGMWTHLERQRGGVGTRGGMGETQIEIDRRIVKEKISKLKEQLAKGQQGPACKTFTGRIHQCRQEYIDEPPLEKRRFRRKQALCDPGYYGKKGGHRKLSISSQRYRRIHQKTPYTADRSVQEHIGRSA